MAPSWLWIALAISVVLQPPCDHAFRAGDEVVAVWTGPNDDGLLPDLRRGEVFTVSAVREGTGGLRLVGRAARSDGYFRADRFCRLAGVS